jgi:hypothetical protein
MQKEWTSTSMKNYLPISLPLTLRWAGNRHIKCACRRLPQISRACSPLEEVSHDVEYISAQLSIVYSHSFIGFDSSSYVPEELTCDLTAPLDVSTFMLASFGRPRPTFLALRFAKSSTMTATISTNIKSGIEKVIKRI